MKKSSNLFLMIVLLAFISYSCSDDDNPLNPNPIVVDPSISFDAGTNFVQSGDSVAVDSVFSVQVTASAGTNGLRSLGVRIDGALLDIDQFFVDGSPATANPFLLFGSDTTSFTKTISIVADSLPFVSHTYEIEIADATSPTPLREVVSFVITTNIDITSLSGRLLSNAGGPAGQGGINLLTGESTGTVSAGNENAQIKDEGIDTDLVPAENWIQKISTINGSILKYPAPGLEFASINSKAQIRNAFNDTDATEFTVSEEIVIDDVFLVENSGTIFIVRVTDIVVTPADNTDYYELSIKY